MGYLKGKYFIIPHYYFYRKPGIANTLDEKESIMRIGAVLVQGPSRHIVPGLDRHVSDQS